MKQTDTTIDTRTAPYAAFVLRLALGSMFIAHALLKIVVFTPAGTVQFFQSIGLPGPLAYVVMTAELIGGAAILIGLHARWVALALVPILIGSAYPHAANGWVFSAPNGGWEYSAFLTVTAIAQALLGEGSFAVTRLFANAQANPALRAA